MAKLIDADKLRTKAVVDVDSGEPFIGLQELDEAPTVEAMEVVHGRWRRSGGDLHSSGYAIYCSVCNKNHFVHYKYSLGGLDGCKELFERPKYCPSCGAIMEEGNDL